MARQIGLRTNREVTPVIMDNEKLNLLVDRLQLEAKTQPKAYQTKVAALAALGYAYIFTIAVFLCLLLGGVALIALKAHAGYFLIKALIPIGAVIFLLVKSVCVKFHRPEGLQITANDAPKLFDTIEEIRGLTRGPQIHTVLINTDFNCCITQQPRLGIFGWHENCLVLGFPLMQAMSTAQFRSVLAHEMGHLSSDHGKFGSWIYGVRSAWVRIYSELRTDSVLGNLLLKNFCKWYTQTFDAYSAVLTRAHELEADQLAARVGGNETAAKALINTCVRGAYLTEKFWPKIFEGAKDCEHPPEKVFDLLSDKMRSDIQPGDASFWLHQGLNAKPIHDDTHPPLAQRLEAMGFADAAKYDEEAISLLVALENDAASELLAAELPELKAKLEAAWCAGVEHAWLDRHHYFMNGRAELARLEVMQDVGQQLSKADNLMLARWTWELRDKDEAVLLYERLLADDPDDATLNSEYGHILLERDDMRGIEHLELAMTKNPMLGLNCCESIYAFLKKLNRDEEAQKYYDRAIGYIGMLTEAMVERNGVTAKDQFADHGLAGEKVREICDRLQQIGQVSQAYLVRKQVTHLTDDPYLILTIKIESRLFRLEPSNNERKVLDSVAANVALPSAGIIVTTTVAPKNLKDANKKLSSALIFCRKQGAQLAASNATAAY